MRLRLSIGLLLAGLLLVASPVASGQESASDQKQIVDGRINALERKIEAAREREGVLSAEIEVVTDKIDALQSDVDAASSRLDQLETVLALHQRKLDRLNQLYELQTRKLVFLQRQHKEAVARLSKRLVEIYTSERTSSLAVVLESGSFSDMLDQLEFLNTIGRQDRKVAGEVETAKLQMQETRNSTRKTRRQVAETTATVAARTAEQRAVRDRLAWSQRAARDRPPRQARDARDRPGGQGSGARAHARPAGRERLARRQDPLRAELVDRARADRRRLRRGLRLAGPRRAHERLRLALGPDARGDRHRRLERDAGRRRRGRNRDRRRLDGRLRQPRRRRPRRRRLDRVRAQHERHGRRRPAGRAGPADRLLREHRATRPARTCTSRCGSTAPRSTRSATSSASYAAARRGGR